MIMIEKYLTHPNKKFRDLCYVLSQKDKLKINRIINCNTFYWIYTSINSFEIINIYTNKDSYSYTFNITHYYHSFDLEIKEDILFDFFEKFDFLYSEIIKISLKLKNTFKFYYASLDTLHFFIEHKEMEPRFFFNLKEKNFWCIIRNQNKKFETYYRTSCYNQFIEFMEKLLVM